MLPVNFPGANIVIVKKADAPPIKNVLEDAPAWFGVDVNQYYCFVVAWQPSYEDRQAINEGRPIYFKAYATALPPISLFTTDLNGIPNE